MKICFIDLLFNWPPRGGADVDVFNVLKELTNNGHDVLLLSLSTTTQNRGIFQPDELPFPAKKITLDYPSSGFLNILRDFLISNTSEFQPDWIIISDCFFLKPEITLFFENLSTPIIWRQYAYELLCQKDILKFLDNKPCPLDYLSTQDQCRKCALYHQKGKILNDEIDAWLEEYLLTKAYKLDYFEKLKNSIQNVQKIIVSSEAMAKVWKCYHSEVVIIPGGVDTDMFQPKVQKNNSIKKIFMPGRVEDTAKGFYVLYNACEKLRKERKDFELICTGGWRHGFPDWVKFTGWLDYGELPDIYSTMDITVVPSIWEEPFGIVALEAMATGIPVIASNTGGLRNIVIHGETGFLFPPGDENALLKHIQSLLSNNEIRTEMGTKARQHVQKNYRWEKVISIYYEKELNKFCKSQGNITGKSSLE